MDIVITVFFPFRDSGAQILLKNRIAFSYK